MKNIRPSELLELILVVIVAVSFSMFTYLELKAEHERTKCEQTSKEEAT